MDCEFEPGPLSGEKVGDLGVLLFACGLLEVLGVVTTRVISMFGFFVFLGVVTTRVISRSESLCAAGSASVDGVERFAGTVGLM